MNIFRNIHPWLTDIGLLIARLTFGGYMCFEHGLKKLNKWDVIKNDFATPFGMPPFWSAGLTIFAEYFCCLMLVFGVFTRWASIPNIICMAVAALVIHAGDPMADRESAFLFLSGFILLGLFGGGRLSIDFLLKKAKIGPWI